MHFTEYNSADVFRPTEEEATNWLERVALVELSRSDFYIPPQDAAIVIPSRPSRFAVSISLLSDTLNDVRSVNLSAHFSPIARSAMSSTDAKPSVSETTASGVLILHKRVLLFLDILL